MLTPRSQPLAEPVEIEIDDTGELWAVVRERDGLGDNLPSDFRIRVQQGGFYGWPYAYIGKPAARRARVRATSPARGTGMPLPVGTPC